MTYLDPDRGDRPELGRDAGADERYPRRRRPRHAQPADEPAVTTADYWADTADGGYGGGYGHAGYGGAGYGGAGYADSGHADVGRRGGADDPDLGEQTAGWPSRARLASTRPMDPPILSGPSVLPDPPVVPGPAGTRESAGPPVPVGVPATPDVPEPTAKPRGRAGRNLPAAIGVGLGLGAAVLASLLLWRPAFLVVVAIAVVVGTWEMGRAVRGEGTQVPMVPVLAGGPLMVALAWFGGPGIAPLGLLATVLAALVWRLADGAAGYQRDVTLAMLIATYVPFLASFAVLLARPADDGHLRVLVTLIGVVLSDTGGYVTGVFLGRHPMAPSVSPKKSWEGFAGSVAWTAAGSAVSLHFLLGAAWWHGAVFGVAVSAASVLGDLAESLIKRDLKIKDMSNLLPGHGGLMDRLDSILLAAPAGYAVLALLVPAVA